MRLLFFLLLLTGIPNLLVLAHESGHMKLRICSQNMHNFANYEVSKQRKNFTYTDWLQQHASLIERFLRSSCDLIIMQELLKHDFSSNNLKQDLVKIILTLKYFSGRSYDFWIADTQDSFLSLGVIYNTKKLKVILKEDLSHLELPKLVRFDKPERSQRGPQRVLFSNLNVDMIFDIYNIHFKSSSAKSGYDVTGYGFELRRMRQAEFLRSYAEQQLESLKVKYKNSSIFSIIAGDRNADYSYASSKILSGELTLSLFSNKQCLLSRIKIAECKNSNRPIYWSAFGGLNSNYPQSASYNYKGKELWLDDILISTKSYLIEFHDKLKLSAGIDKKSKAASDHALLFIDIH